MHPDIITEIQEVDLMAARVLQRHLDINMACAKEFPTQGGRRQRGHRPTGGRAKTGGIRMAARKPSWGTNCGRQNHT